MTDLFGYNPSPRPIMEPGYKRAGTSKEAAESMKPTAELLRTRVLESLRIAGPSTPDEVAKRLNLSVLAVRPRFSELSRAEKIEYTGERRSNDSGRSAKVFRARG